MVCRVPLYLYATVESLWLTTFRCVLSSEAHAPLVKWKNLFLLPVSLHCLPSWLVWFHLWLIVREEWISFWDTGPFFFPPPSLRDTHLHSLPDEPVIVTGPKVTVKHLSDIVDVQSWHFFFVPEVIQSGAPAVTHLTVLTDQIFTAHIWPERLVNKGVSTDINRATVPVGSETFQMLPVYD